MAIDLKPSGLMRPSPVPQSAEGSMSPRVWTSSLRIGIPRATALAWMPIERHAPMADSSISNG